MSSNPDSSGWHTDPADPRYRRFHDGHGWTRRRVLQVEVEPLPEAPYQDPSARKVVIVGEPPSIYVA